MPRSRRRLVAVIVFYNKSLSTASKSSMRRLVGGSLLEEVKTDTGLSPRAQHGWRKAELEVVPRGISKFASQNMVGLHVQRATWRAACAFGAGTVTLDGSTSVGIGLWRRKGSIGVERSC